MPDLIDILPVSLRNSLTPGEGFLLRRAVKGEPAVLSSDNAQENDLAKADHMGGPVRTIRPELLYWLCTDEDAARIVHARGITILGAKVPGELDFDSAVIRHPLRFNKCAIGEILLMDTETRFLAFVGCHTGPIFADRLNARGSLFLRGTKVSGNIPLLGAEIGGTSTAPARSLRTPEATRSALRALLLKAGCFSGI